MNKFSELQANTSISLLNLEEQQCVKGGTPLIAPLEPYTLVMF